MKYDFIHIGMMKSATTYMQNLLLIDSNYSLSWNNSMKFLHELRNNIKNEQLEKQVKASFSSDIIIKQHSKANVLSNEGFSTAFLNDIDNQDKIPNFIEYSSRSLNNNVNSNNLLITIRGPISWIKSIYIQSIKEGWSGSAQDFVEKQENFVLHSLNLRMIINYYKRYFDNILVLPFEFLKQSEDIFWRIISDSFQVPVVEARLSERINTSLNLERTFLLSQMNQMSRLLTDTLLESDNYQNVREKKLIVKTHLSNEKWVHRRFVENATEQNVRDLYGLFNLEAPDKDFFSFKLSPHLLDSIQKNYIDFLRENIIPDIADMYQKELDQYTKNSKM